MAILRPTEIRDMTPAERQAELDELETELLNAKAVQAAGGAPENPGRIRELRRTIARIKTIQHEEDDPEDVSTGDAIVPGFGDETDEDGTEGEEE